jgi:hypothetical protein|tara:strand:- start:2065 stop:2262 length:198 start_codon:yes stop_codon:yes gene_type:complete
LDKNVEEIQKEKSMDGPFIFRVGNKCELKNCGCKTLDNANFDEIVTPCHDKCDCYMIRDELFIPE